MSLSLEKGLRLLLAVSESGAREFHGVPLKDLAAATDLDKATAHRLLRSLARYDFVQQDEGGGYALGNAARALAHAATQSNLLIQRMMPAMRAVHAATDETINLAERHQRSSVTVYEIPSPQQVRYTTRIGAASPLHLGASSRATLAFSPAALQDEILAGVLVAQTLGSITDPATLKRTLSEIRRTGHAMSLGERVTGTNAIAVPLLNAQHEAVGSLAILWPSRGASEDRRRKREWPQLLLDAVRDVQGTL